MNACKLQNAASRYSPTTVIQFSSVSECITSIHYTHTPTIVIACQVTTSIHYFHNSTGVFLTKRRATWLSLVRQTKKYFSKCTRDVPDIRFRFAGYPAVF